MQCFKNNIWANKYAFLEKNYLHDKFSTERISRSLRTRALNIGPGRAVGSRCFLDILRIRDILSQIRSGKSRNPDTEEAYQFYLSTYRYTEDLRLVLSNLRVSLCFQTLHVERKFYPKCIPNRAASVKLWETS